MQDNSKKSSKHEERRDNYMDYLHVKSGDPEVYIAYLMQCTKYSVSCIYKAFFLQIFSPGKMVMVVVGRGGAIKWGIPPPL